MFFSLVQPPPRRPKGPSSQWVCGGEDHRPRQDLATRPLLRHRLSQGFSSSPDQDAAQPWWDLLLHTAPYWQQSIPRPHGELHWTGPNVQLCVSHWHEWLELPLLSSADSVQSTASVLLRLSSRQQENREWVFVMLQRDEHQLWLDSLQIQWQVVMTSRWFKTVDSCLTVMLRSIFFFSSFFFSPKLWHTAQERWKLSNH